MNKIENYELIEAQEEAKVDFAIMLNNLLEEKNISYTELSNRTGKSKSLVSRIMGGSNNLTIETMVSLLYAINEKLVITTSKSLYHEYAIFFDKTIKVTSKLHDFKGLTTPINFDEDQWETLPTELVNFKEVRIAAK
jgi:DNA-binding helix-turn-helix protein